MGVLLIILLDIMHFKCINSTKEIVVEAGAKRVPIEVKLSATPRSAMASAWKTFQKDVGDNVLKGYAVLA